MKHYICTGSCHGVSPTPKNCGEKTCAMHDHPLVPCECTDGKHGRTDEGKTESKKEEQKQS